MRNSLKNGVFTSAKFLIAPSVPLNNGELVKIIEDASGTVWPKPLYLLITQSFLLLF
jgi:hypothetical protein